MTPLTTPYTHHDRAMARGRICHPLGIDLVGHLGEEVVQVGGEEDGR